MSSSTRISEASLKILKALAEKEKTTLQAVLEKAIKEYQKKIFFNEVSMAFSNLKKNKESWNGLQEEYNSLEGTIADGLMEGDFSE